VFGTTRNRLVLTAATASAVVAVGGAAIAGPASAHGFAPVRLGHSFVLPKGGKVLGAAPKSAQLSLTIVMKPRDEAALSQFSTAVSTPGSTRYGQYVSVPQFAHRFGATPRALREVRRVLTGKGLTVGAPTANTLTIPVHGTVADAERAFSTSLERVQLRSGRAGLAAATSIGLPRAIAADVATVDGLNTVVDAMPADLQHHLRAHSYQLNAALSKTSASLHPAAKPHVVPTGGPLPCAAATSADTTDVTDGKGYAGYTYDQLASKYGFASLYAQGDLGAGQTIAVFEQQPYLPADIAAFDSCYGINPPLQVINVGGGPGPYQTYDGTDGTGDGESALDIETLQALAPQATVQIYQGPAPITASPSIYSAIASANQAKVVSSSFGSCEKITNMAGPNQVQAEEPIFQEMAAQGQSFFVSAGDHGADDCQQADGVAAGVNALDPAGDPYATAVGGTSLYPGATAATSVDYLWQEEVHGDGATGGGLSSIFGMPSYQTSAAAGLGVTNANSAGQAVCGQATCREEPDISADADLATGYTVYDNGGTSSTDESTPWSVVGGTSASAPLIAAFTALTNEQAACRGRVVGFANPALYAIAGSGFAANFNDVTSVIPNSGAPANNDYNGTTNGEYPVTAGYDMTTGLGTPIGGALAASLCNVASPRYTVTLTTPPAQASTVGTPVALQIAGADSGAQALTYAATGLPAGLVINPTTGAITGTPTTAGVSSVTVTAGDQFTNAGSTAAFSWTVTAPPPPAPAPAPAPTKKKSATNKPINVKLTGLAKRNPSLSFGWNVAKGSPALTALAIKLPKGLSFASAKKVAKGLVVKSAGKTAKDKVKLKQGVLTITLSKKATKLTVSLSKPALKITKAEATKIKKKKVKSLKLTVTATNAKKKTIARSVTVSKLS